MSETFPSLSDASDFNDLAVEAGLDAVRAQINAAVPVAPDADPLAAATETQQSAWPAPREIKSELPPAPAFDANVLLPHHLAEFVLDEADRMVAPPDFFAAALIVSLGSVVGARCGIKPKRNDDWIVVPNLWGGVVAPPSAKKTPTMQAVIRFIDRLELKAAEKLTGSMKVYEAEMAAFEAHQSAIKASMKKAAGATKPGQNDMQSAITNLQNLQAPEEPHARRFKSSDSTVAKLGDLLVKNPQGLLVFRDELIGLLASWDKEDNEGDRAFYLESHNGTGSFNIDRIARGSLHIPNLCLSVFGGIQDELMERYLAGMSASLDNDGRVQRFQVLVFPESVPWEWRDRYPVKGAREAVRDLFERLANFDPIQDGAAPADDFVKLPHFHFDDEAQEIFVEWCTDLYTVQIASEKNPLMQQHLGKFEKLFCSIALILHLSSDAIGAVKAATAIRAAAWCEYLAGHARRVYGLVETAKVNTTRMVGRRIASGKLIDGFTARDVVRKQWAGVTTTMQAETALAALEEHGWINGIDTDNLTGRPTTRYYVNPQVREVAA